MNRRAPTRQYPPRLPGPTDGLTIGLMGGSFDPPHSGHAHVIETARKALGLDWVWVIPAAGNPLKKTQTAFIDRFNAAHRRLSGPRTRVTPIEARQGLRYSIDLVRMLKARAPGARFVWIMGADCLGDFHRWRAWEALTAEVAIAVVSRPGASPKAGLSRFARRFASRRLPASAATTLARAAPPAWVFITAPFDPASSGALRAKRLADAMVYPA
jgi:nicotinate-nucleotide adenylyltransferase